MMRFQLVLLTHIGEPQFRRGPRVFRKLWCLHARSCNHSLPQISFSTEADRETFFASAGRKPPSCEDWTAPRLPCYGVLARGGSSRSQLGGRGPLRGPRMSAIGAALKPVSCKFERAVA